MFRLALVLSAVVATVPVLQAEEAKPLLTNGGFEAQSGGKAVDWGQADGATFEAEGGNHFLRLRSEKPGETVLVYRAVSVPAKAQALRLSYKVRYEGIERGKQAWFDGRIMMNFLDGSKAKLKPAPSAPSFVGTSKGWQERSQVFRVPEGAKTLEMMFTLFQAKAGRLDFDDVALEVSPVAVVEAGEAEAKRRREEQIKAAPKPVARVAVPSAGKLPPALRVDGKRLVDARGRDVWLQGVAIPSLEWSGGGDHILQSIEVALRDWKANCVRLPVREHFWGGTGPYQRDGGAAYRQLVDDAVNACAGARAYIVIDLHDYRAPQEKHADFWREVAGRYKNHPAVLFDLLNEPHDVPWEVWRDGGPVTDAKTSDKVAAENKEKLVAFQSVGMQGLLNVVRGAGARNVAIVGGLDWGYDLGGVLEGRALEDRSGDGVMYSSHVYPWKRDWRGKFLAVAEKHPVFLGEVGADEKKMDFLPADVQEDPKTWAPDMLAAIQKHRLHWTAWSFHPKATPRVILDWDYTPSPFWGALVKRALAGEAFPGGKLR